MTTFFSAHSDVGSVNDLREWSEEQLIAAPKRGRKAPFGELCERQVKKVFWVAQRIMRNREDAEDVMQDSFLSAFLHLNDFDERSRFVTWLTRITANAALAKLRKRGGIREVSIDGPGPSAELGGRWEIQDSTADPEEMFRLHERKEIVNTAVLRLRPRLRSVVGTPSIPEYSLTGTAQILGISTTAVKARMFHARVALRRMPLLQSAASSVRTNIRIKRKLYVNSSQV